MNPADDFGNEYSLHYVEANDAPTAVHKARFFVALGEITRARTKEALLMHEELMSKQTQPRHPAATISELTRFHERLSCPCCGNDNIGLMEFRENTYLYQSLSELQDYEDTVFVDSDHYIAYEDTFDERFHCCECGADFPVPEDLELNFV